MKSGLKTTEFWARLIPMLTGLGVAGGMVEKPTADAVNELAGDVLPIVQTVVDGLVRLAGLFMSFWLSVKYGQERASLKMADFRLAIARQTPAGGARK